LIHSLLRQDFLATPHFYFTTTTMKFLSAFLLVYQALITKSTATAASPTVKIQFYGEAQCPFCRQFFTEVFVPQVWLDVEGLRQHIDFDMVAWGNSYFATVECGKGPYSSDERACWYKKCMANNLQHDCECFKGDSVYQHGEKEGIVDVYETCIKVDYSLEDAVAFTYCAEGSIMDNQDLKAEQILKICSVSLNNVDSDAVQRCYEERGKKLEIANAQATPEHPGVPYVLLDGESLDNPMGIKAAICDALQTKGIDKLPDSCNNGNAHRNHLRTHKATK
jgi:hypothetical protein